MIRIVLCDDDQGFLTHLEGLTADILREIDMAYDIKTFASPTELLSYYDHSPHPFDIAFLDVEMPGMDGLSLAKKIRRRDDQVLLIFLTSHDQFVFHAFEVEAFRYLNKKNHQQELKNIILCAIEKIKKTGNLPPVFLQKNGKDTLLRQEAIMYIEKQGKNCVYHCGNGFELSVRQSLRTAFDALSDMQFVQIHSGCIVNMEYILSIKDGELALSNGTTLPISRLRFSKIRSDIHRYWGKRV